MDNMWVFNSFFTLNRKIYYEFEYFYNWQKRNMNLTFIHILNKK